MHVYTHTPPPIWFKLQPLSSINTVADRHLLLLTPKASFYKQGNLTVFSQKQAKKHTQLLVFRMKQSLRIWKCHWQQLELTSLSQESNTSYFTLFIHLLKWPLKLNALFFLPCKIPICIFLFLFFQPIAFKVQHFSRMKISAT